ncbi:hypothetical protein AF332_07495 [Sporosarcina globispora]|uniref:Uncharacterized protein n=1 Tax=Sporosarcina globispora TaxID=1459 RepID=A0A0M0GB37_SPOGL|nr:hypothetical protein AF332_07495 [Sporosarcina globispora]
MDNKQRLAGKLVFLNAKRKAEAPSGQAKTACSCEEYPRLPLLVLTPGTSEALELYYKIKSGSSPP